MAQIIITVENNSIIPSLKKVVSLLKGVTKVRVAKDPIPVTANDTTKAAIKAAKEGKTIKCKDFEDYLLKVK